MWDLIVSVPDHCLSFYLETTIGTFSIVNKNCLQNVIKRYMISLEIRSVIFIMPVSFVKLL